MPRVVRDEASPISEDAMLSALNQRYHVSLAVFLRIKTFSQQALKLVIKGLASVPKYFHGSNSELWRIVSDEKLNVLTMVIPDSEKNCFFA